MFSSSHLLLTNAGATATIQAASPHPTVMKEIITITIIIIIIIIAMMIILIASLQSHFQ